MGNIKKTENKSRRNFFSLLLSSNRKDEKIKMLTADGKLVEVDKNVVAEAAKKQKSTNKEIFNWMKNPSKDKN